MHITINNCGGQDATYKKRHIVIVARSAFVINNCRWLRLTVKSNTYSFCGIKLDL